MATLKQVRRFIAPYLGPFGVITSNASSTTTSLAFATSPWKSTIPQDDLLSDLWLFRPDAALAADKLRRVTSSGYNPSSGTLTPDLAWTNAPANAEEVELYGLIPPYGDGSGTADLHFLINEGLKRCLLVDEFTFSPSSATAQRHSLASAASWLTDPQLVYQVGILGPSDVRADTDPYTWHRVTGRRVKLDQTVYLEGFSAQTTDVVYVKAGKPAYYAVQAAGAGDYTQSGMSLDTDVCIPELRWIAAATLVEAWERLSHLLAAGDQDRAKRERAEAAAWFSRETDINFQEPESTFEVEERLLHFGPPASYGRGGPVFDGSRFR